MNTSHTAFSGELSSSSPKKALRLLCLNQRKTLPPEQIANKGLLLFAQLLNLPHWHSARCVALYAAQPFEVPTSKLFETLWGIHKHTCFPAPGLHAPSLALVSSLEDLAPGPYGILFPKPHCPPVAMANVELILVPGLAFAKNGARLGRGGGFYDKLLAAPEMKALRVGLCFEEYLVENLPEEAHDVRMHWVVTDKQCLRCLPTPP